MFCYVYCCNSVVILDIASLLSHQSVYSLIRSHRINQLTNWGFRDCVFCSLVYLISRPVTYEMIHMFCFAYFEFVFLLFLPPFFRSLQFIIFYFLYLSSFIHIAHKNKRKILKRNKKHSKRQKSYARSKCIVLGKLASQIRSKRCLLVLFTSVGLSFQSHWL